MNLRTEPVRIANGSDEDGLLVFTEDNRLAAIVTQLTDSHEGMAGLWFLEAGFGPVDGRTHPVFPTVDVALDYIMGRLRAGSTTPFR